ncbi:MAG: DUF2190 family protein [Planctomycetia bacterium]|nr:DUF2190 family protein [Planctomycetia bacterium]
MQAQFIHDGAVIDYTPTVDISAGDIIVVGTLVGVTRLDLPAGVNGSLWLTGVYDIAKATEAFGQGDMVYWNRTLGRAQSVATGNIPLGQAVTASSETDTTVRVRLQQTSGSLDEDEPQQELPRVELINDRSCGTASGSIGPVIYDSADHYTANTYATLAATLNRLITILADAGVLTYE